MEQMIAPRSLVMVHGLMVADPSLEPGPATISPCTIPMDHDAIICFMIDRLARAPDADVHVPSVGSSKYPFRSADVVYF